MIDSFWRIKANAEAAVLSGEAALLASRGYAVDTNNDAGFDYFAAITFTFNRPLPGQSPLISSAPEK
jgi:hypothetical protein